MKNNLEKADLVGTWKLVRHGSVNLAGEFTPTTEYHEGQLIYAADGAMSILITLHTDVLKVEEMIAFAGTFSVEGEKILHHIKVSPKKTRRGTTETRFPKLDGKTLVVTTPPNETGFHRITWEKI